MRLAGVIAGQGPNADVAVFDDMVIQTLIQREVGNEASPLAGREPAELLEALEPRRGPERVLDFMLRSGPYGDGFGSDPDGLTLDLLEQTPHGIDLGPLQPRLPEVLRTASGKVELAPEPIVADLDRLRAAMARERNGGMVLIGRRQLRSNNSWMHNLPALVKGKERCTLHIHPDDAERLGLADGEAARISSAAGSTRGASRDHRGHHARRGVDPARLGPRRPGCPDGRGLVARRREQQRAGRRIDGRAAVRERCPERDSGRGDRAKWR